MGKMVNTEKPSRGDSDKKNIASETDTYEELKLRVNALEKAEADWKNREKALLKQTEVIDACSQKQAEETLQANEAFLNAVFNSITDGISVLNPDLTIRKTNRVMEQWYSDSAPLIGKKCHAAYHLSEVQCDPCPTLRCFKSGKLETETEIVPGLPGSDTKALQITCFPIINEDTSIVTGVVEFVRDITDQVHRETEIRKARNYISNIIDSMPSMIIGVDSKGMVTQWNHEAERLTGLTRQEAVGWHLTRAVPRFSREINKVHKAIQTRQEQVISKRPYHHKGENRYEDVTIYPLVSNGEEGAVIRVDDVTQKVRIEETLIQNEKMNSVGGLAAGMAHEINNPVSGIIQNASLLSNRLTDKTLPANLKAAESAEITMEEIHRFVEARNIPGMIKAIIDSGLKVASIVENMVNFAQKSDATYSSHDPILLMDKILELLTTDYNLKKRYDFKSIMIEKEYEDNLPMLVCEGSKIQQVILNILKNGAYAMFEKSGKRKPKFILRLCRAEVPDALRIEIEDNGPGMDQATCKRIFEPFFTTKPAGSGTGLGLSVSYFIITENHGGTLDVISEPGKGTRFIICLPLKRKRGQT